jgi:hypothetical protein
MRSVDDRTGQITYYFDGASWLSTESNFGGIFSVSFWAYWNELTSWSRIIDFGNGPGNNNLLIANEGGSNNLFFRSGRGNQVRDIRCAGAI